MDHKVDDKYQGIFQAYSNLQSESYEFIVRTIAMHNWLKEAYRLTQENPELSAEEMYMTLQPSFENVYDHLFALFLRPYRVLMLPFGEYMETFMENMAPRSMASTFLGYSRIWGESQSKFLNSTASAFRSYSNEINKLSSDNNEFNFNGWHELTPVSLIKNIADEETTAYFETLDAFLGYFGEGQFLLPKAYIMQLQKFVSSYPKVYKLAQGYEGMLHGAWDKSLRKFTLAVKSKKETVEFDEFYKSYIVVFTEEYDQLLRSPEFIQVQADFNTIMAEFVITMRSTMEAQMQMFPASPFVARAEVEVLEQRVHGYKKRLDGLERQVRDLERKLGSVLQESAIKS